MNYQGKTFQEIIKDFHFALKKVNQMKDYNDKKGYKIGKLFHDMKKFAAKFPNINTFTSGLAYELVIGRMSIEDVEYEIENKIAVDNDPENILIELIVELSHKVQEETTLKRVKLTPKIFDNIFSDYKDNSIVQENKNQVIEDSIEIAAGSNCHGFEYLPADVQERVTNIIKNIQNNY